MTNQALFVAFLPYFSLFNTIYCCFGVSIGVSLRKIILTAGVSISVSYFSVLLFKNIFGSDGIIMRYLADMARQALEYRRRRRRRIHPLALA